VKEVGSRFTPLQHEEDSLRPVESYRFHVKGWGSEEAARGRVRCHLSWVIGKIGNRRNPPQSSFPKEEGDEELMNLERG